MEEQAPEISIQPQKPVQPVLENSALPKKKFDLKVIVILLMVISLVAGGVYAGMKIGKKQAGGNFPPESIIPSIPDQTICSTEAKICPDGSSVGRVGPNCEFAPCPQVTEIPNETADWKTYINSQFAYSFRYPPDWKVEISGFSKWEPNGFPFISKIDNSYRKIIVVYRQDEKGNFDPMGNENVFNPQGWEQTTIDSKPMFFKKHILGGDHYSDDYMVKIGEGKYININIVTEDPNQSVIPSSASVQKANQILATLRFLD